MAEMTKEYDLLRQVEQRDKRIGELERDLEKEVSQRDHWETKATELACDIGKALGFEVGEHSNMNCPVQAAIDGVYHMGAQIEDWRTN